MGLELQENAALILRGQGGGSDGSHHAGQQLTPYPSTGFRSESGPKQGSLAGPLRVHLPGGREARPGDQLEGGAAIGLLP
jgi:hypothetical protein